MEEMAAKVVELALEQGIWAALYIYLFFRMLKENRDREERYQGTIDQLSSNISSGIRDIQEKLEEIILSDGRTD